MNLSTTPRRSKHTAKFPMLNIPRALWCDFRIDYVENNMTLAQLAVKYYCDPRTVRNCIQHNKSSFELGKKSTPTRIHVYEQQIRDLLEQDMVEIPEEINTIYGLSHYLFPLLQEKGYSGSERTLRNHLQSQPYVKAILEKRECSIDQTKTQS